MRAQRLYDAQTVLHYPLSHGPSMNDVTTPKRTSTSRSVRQAYVVLGMHRSGTSALTRVLSLAGATLPKALMAPGADNPKGFWESTAIADLNDEILDSVDSEWDDVFALRPRPFLANFDTAFLARAVETLEADFGSANPIVLKDPRISILAPFWTRALREFGADPRFIIAVRHPIEVAGSLMARNQMPMAKSALVWASYMIAAERDTRDEKRVFVSYDAMLANWREQVQRIEAQTGMPLPRMTPRTTSEIDSFLNADDRHHRADPKSLERRRDIPAWIQSVADWMEAAANDKNPSPKEIEALSQNLLGAEETFGTVIADSRARFNGLKRELSEAQTVLMKNEWDIKDLQKIIAENTELAGAEIERREKDFKTEWDRLQGEIARIEKERLEEHNTLLGEQARFNTEWQRLQDEITRLEAERLSEHMAAGKVIEKLNQELASLNNEVAKGITPGKIAEFEARIAEISRDRDQAVQLIETERDVAKGEFERRDAELAEERKRAAAELERLNRLAAELDAELVEERARAAAEIERLQKRVADLDAELSARRNDLETTKQQLEAERRLTADEFDRRDEVLRTERHAAAAERERLASLLADTDAKALELTNQVRYHQGLLEEERQTAISEYERRDRELEHDRSIARAEVDRLNQLAEEMGSEALRLRAQLEEAIASRATVLELISELEDAVEQARLNNTGALELIETERAAARAEFERLNDVIRANEEAARLEIERLTSEINALQAAITSKTAENENATATLRAETETQLGEYRQRLEQAEAERSNFESLVSEADQRANHAQREAENILALLAAERELARSEYERLNNEIQNERGIASTEFERLNAEIQQTGGLNQELLARLNERETRISVLEVEHQSALAAVERLNSEFSLATVLNRSLNTQIVERDAALDSFEAELQAFRNHNTELLSQVGERDDKLSHLQAEYNSQVANIERLTADIASLNDLVAVGQGEAETLRLDRDNAVEILMTEREIARAEFARLADEIEAERTLARGEFERLNGIIDYEKAQKAEKEAQVGERTARVEELEQLHETAVAEITALLASQSSLSADVSERTARIEHLEGLHGAAVAEINALLASQSSLSADVSERTARIEHLEGLHAAAIADHEAAQANVETLRLSLAETTSRYALRVADLEGLVETDRAIARSEFARRDAELTAERAVVFEERAAKQAQIEDLTRRMNDRARDSLILSQELESIRQSTTWKMTDPLRRFLSQHRGLAATGRRALKLAWWTVTLQLPKRLAARQEALPAPSDAPAAPIADRPTNTASLLAPPTAPLDGRPQPADLSGLIKEMRDEFGPSAPVAWLETHAATFGLPFDPNGGKTPKWSLTNEEAESLAQKVREMAAGWPSEVENPDVSIIIPVYNQLAFTLGCVASLFANTTRYSFEIIIGDDASTDQTAAVLEAGLPRTHTVRQTTNVGFIKNCNAAAAVARGRVIVMLNNDTITLPGWLDELVATLDDPAIGMSGSKLLYPDGRLQEAGGIVWRDASAWNLGRLDQARRPEYSYRRDVDYMSGASIALRADTWRLLRGFDDWYDVAYGEDTDLAFRVRQIGLRTALQPLSMLVHFEGVSAGTDTAEGMKAYQIGNARKLAERWAPVLATHRPNAESPELEKERSVTKRVLVIDACTPEPDKDAGSLTCMELMRAFQKNGYKVTFIPEDNFLFMPHETRALQREGIEVIYWPFYGSVDDYLTRTGSLYEAVVIFRVGTAAKHIPTIRKRAPQARIMFHTSDVHFVREEREAALSGDTAMADRAKATRTKELAVINSADLTILHSTYEASILAQAAPDARAYVFPWILDTKPCELGPFDRSDMMFLGGYRHGPNVDAVKHFVADIWPLVRAELPDARFHIVGSEAPSELRAMDGQNGIVFVGHVPDLDDAFRTIRMSVAPIRFGAGIKGKVAMSLAYGVPVVATTVAAEGMGLSHGEDALIADDPAEFARCVIALYRDHGLWERLSGAGLRFVSETYGSALGKRRVAEMLSLAGVASR